MPALDSKTEFVFRRSQMAGTSNATGLGPLILPVSRELRNRRLYFSVNWQGFTDWKATGILTLCNGHTPVETFRFNWGTIYQDQASFDTWQTQKGDLGLSSGGPAYSVEVFDAVAFPNGPVCVAPDALRLLGMSNVDGLSELGYATVMHPFSWFGSIDNIRFQWLDVSGRFSATPSVDAASFAEVYIGCKSIVG